MIPLRPNNGMKPERAKRANSGIITEIKILVGWNRINLSKSSKKSV